MFTEPFEMGPIRPPSEAHSLLIRATRNCSWNRCRFCQTYKGTRFELRLVEEIKQDIIAAKEIQDSIKALALKHGDGNIQSAILSVMRNPPSQSHYNVALWMYAGSEHVFLQDANTIIMRTPDLVEVLKFLKATLSTITRITSYGRSKTAAQKSLTDLKAIHEAGLTRLHIGLESGSDTVLKAMNKGVTAEEQIEGGKKVVASGISLSEYVLQGLGGRALWREHALETARVLNAIDPDYIRIRSLSIYPGLEMEADVENGSFVRMNDEEMVEELSLMIENMEVSSNLASDHIGNLLEEVQGKLPDDKNKMLAVISRFQKMPQADRTQFIVGRRAGIYRSLDDMNDARKYESVAQIVKRLTDEKGCVDDEAVHQLRQAYT